MTILGRLIAHVRFVAEVTRQRQSEVAARGFAYGSSPTARTRRGCRLCSVAPKSGKMRVIERGRGYRKVTRCESEWQRLREKVKLRKTKGKHKLKAKVKGEKSRSGDGVGLRVCKKMAVAPSAQPRPEAC